MNVKTKTRILKCAFLSPLLHQKVMLCAFSQLWTAGGKHLFRLLELSAIKVHTQRTSGK